MSKVTDLQHWSWAACEAVNKMVECDEPIELIHSEIQRVREFFEARAEQTKPHQTPVPQSSTEDNFHDLLGL